MTDYNQYHNSISLSSTSNPTSFQQNQCSFDKNVSIPSTFGGNDCYPPPQRQAYNHNAATYDPITLQHQQSDSKSFKCFFSLDNSLAASNLINLNLFPAYMKSTNFYDPTAYYPQHVANYPGPDAISGMQLSNFRDSYTTPHPPNKGN